MFVLLVFFFFKQKTAYEMCGRDWSSDVCSSDLVPASVGVVSVLDNVTPVSVDVVAVLDDVVPASVDVVPASVDVVVVSVDTFFL